jgi:hypothetical protein
MSYVVLDAPKIVLADATLSSGDLLKVTLAVNATLTTAGQGLGDISLQLFDIMDLRMLSGLVGELFVTELCSQHKFLSRNPNIDGYPDALDVSRGGLIDTLLSLAPGAFIKFEHGGLEIKNTFGLKKARAHIGHRESRLPKIQKRLVWKAHHQETNSLIALQSDFVEGIPQVVAVFFSNELSQADWTKKQNPKEGSTMTSFSQTTSDAFDKLRRGLMLYRKDIGLDQYLGTDS